MGFKLYFIDKKLLWKKGKTQFTSFPMMFLNDLLKGGLRTVLFDKRLIDKFSE